MIGWLSGVVRFRDVQRGEVVLDVGGVGYLVTVSWQTLADVPQRAESCELWIHTHVREESLQLFGFSQPAERDAFRLLTGVPQVGPKLAVAVLVNLGWKAKVVDAALETALTLPGANESLDGLVRRALAQLMAR